MQKMCVQCNVDALFEHFNAQHKKKKKKTQRFEVCVTVNVSLPEQNDRQ